MSRGSEAVIVDLAPMWHLQDLMRIMMNGCDGIALHMCHSQKHKSTAFAMQCHIVMYGVLILPHISEAQTHDQYD